MAEKSKRAEVEQALKVMNSVLGQTTKKRDHKLHHKAEIKAQKTV